MNDILLAPQANEGQDILSFLETFERPPRLSGTIAWVHKAAPLAVRSEVAPREAMADELLWLTEGFTDQPIIRSAPVSPSWYRGRGVVLSCGVAMTTLAFGVVLAAWSDVAASPGLRPREPELTIAAVEPAEGAPAQPRTVFFTIERNPELVIDASGMLDAESDESLDEGEGEPSVEHLELAGIEGAALVEAASVELPHRSASRATRAMPFGVGRTRPPRAAQETEEATSEGADASMVFDRNELEVPSTLTRGQVNAGLRRVSRLVRNCSRSTPDRSVRVDMVIRGATGRVGDVRVRGFLGTTTAGACVTRALGRARFPRFQDPELSIDGYPLVLR